MNATAAPARITPEQYLELERAAVDRSEFVDGVMYAMAGGTLRHSYIQSNLSSLLSNGLRSGPCRVSGSDLKIQVSALSAFFYPDLAVTCEEPVDFGKDALENPVFLLEVLSPSTERYDRTKKFHFYRSIPSFRQYALVSQEEPRVEVFTKSPEGFWIYTDFVGLDALADFSVLGIQAPLAAIYERIEFEPLPLRA